MTVIEQDLSISKGHGTFWKCKCSCGNVKSIRNDSLTSGKTKSCGKTNACSERKNTKPIIDLKGKKFGKLTVIKRNVNPTVNTKQAVWECLCECGNFVNVDGFSLRSGNTKSCGCAKGKLRENLTGQNFGILKVLKKDYAYGESKWICKCECGNQVSVRASALKSGNTQSCGCLKMSHGELLIYTFLKENNIDFIQEYTPLDLTLSSNKILRFDFYLPKYNLCIEYDGKQHFEPIKYFGGEEAFKIRKRNDNIKNRYCKNKNIKLLRFSYKENNEAILNTILKYIRESCNDHSDMRNCIAYADNSLKLS